MKQLAIEQQSDQKRSDENNEGLKDSSVRLKINMNVQLQLKNGQKKD